MGEKVKKKQYEEVNLLYLNEKKADKKKKKNQKKKNKPEKDQSTQLFDFDNEIIIGMKKLPEEEKKSKKKKKKSVNKSNIAKQKKETSPNKDPQKEETSKTHHKNKRVRTFVKCITIITLIVGIALFLLESPMLNILEIKVENNEKLSSEEIIALSEIKIGDNIFKTNRLSVERKLKQNSYIESISLNRDLPSTITIVVKERKATYMLQTNDEKYAYINNQGYILEMNDETANLPKLTSYTTEDLYSVQRLNNQDLEKLEIVLKIMETANGNQIGDLITEIDIASKNNIILRLESEKKTIYLGDASDINTKMLYIKATLENEKDVEGELFMDGETNKEGEYLFREKV